MLWCESGCVFASLLRWFVALITSVRCEFSDGYIRFGPTDADAPSIKKNI